MLTPGEILKSRRKSLGKTVFEVSQDTRILEKYIKQLEANDFEAFDSPVFARGFIKIYSEYLGLDDEKVIALFRREGKEIFERQRSKKKKKLNIKYTDLTKYILYLTTLVIISLFIFYTAVQIKLYQEQPTLNIITPITGYTSEIGTISIEGTSIKQADIFVNSNKIENNNGNFKGEIALNEGENTLTIKAINQRNKNKIIENVIKIYYTKPNPVEEVEVTKTTKLTLKIKSADTWVKLIVDNRQELAQTVKAGFTKSYTAKTSFELVSGRIDNTQLYINDKLWPLNINTQTGIASLSCKLENGEVICPK